MIKYSVNEHVFDLLTPVSSYWLGMMASDGYILRDRDAFGLHSCQKDRKHIEDFKSFLEYTGEVKDRVVHCKGKEYGASGIIVTSAYLIHLFNQYGIVAAKSNQDIDYIDKIPLVFKIFFIVGYLDGDGSVICREKDNSYEFTIIGNLQCLISMQKYLRSFCDIDCSVKPTKSNKYILRICRYESVYNFSKYYLNLNDNTTLSRKREKVEKIYSFFKQYYENNKGRKRREHIEPSFCKLCGKLISSGSNYCSSCIHLYQRKVERPTREVLKKELRLYSFLKLGEKYNVTDNAVRKWCKQYNLPHSSMVIKKYNDTDWDSL